MLAKELVRRANIFMERWCASVGAETFETPESVEIDESYEFLEWACDQDTEGPVWPLISFVRSCVPKKHTSV